MGASLGMGHSDVGFLVGVPEAWTLGEMIPSDTNKAVGVCSLIRWIFRRCGVLGMYGPSTHTVMLLQSSFKSA